MGYHVVIKRRAEKELAELPAKSRALVAHFIRDELEGCKDPRKVGDGKNLEGVAGGWRWRIGVYRLLAVIDDKEIAIQVFRAGHRQSVYKNLPR
ncbi:MAG: type II toxin-antitoxin system RelE/ParE family toxin [Eggerthellaceae bacterium]|nr:type II toxin-antitoxin system RelE/ParE family toxin [Eggerthellaceae bacterium]